MHGYARKRDCARLVNAYHAQLVGLGVHVWVEWVPSAANPADIPTRPERLHELPADVQWVDLELPPVEAIEGQLAAWLLAARESRDAARAQ